MKTHAIGRAVVNWRQGLKQQYQLISPTAAMAGVQRCYVITTWQRPFSQSGYQRDGCGVYISTRAMVLISVCCTQRVHSVTTRKLVCNKRKSVLMESVLTVLSHIEINGDSARTRKKSNKRVSVITESVIMKFYCIQHKTNIKQKCDQIKYPITN